MHYIYSAISAKDPTVLRATLAGESQMGCEYMLRQPNDQGQTALHWVAERGLHKHLAILLEFGAKLEIQDAAGLTPLMAAVAGRKDNLACVKLLIAQGANPWGKTEEGNGLVHLACLKGHLKTLRYLVETVGLNVLDIGQEGYSPLALAVSQGNTQCVDYLLRQGASPNQSGFSAETSFHIAARSRQWNLLARLLEHPNPGRESWK